MGVIIKEWGCFARQKRFATKARRHEEKLKCRLKTKEKKEEKKRISNVEHRTRNYELPFTIYD